jgi:hypothetical protein
MKRGRTVFEKLELVFFNLVKRNKLKERKFLQLTNVNELEKLVVPNGIDTILANDLETWPVAFALKARQPNLKVILDAHEYYPRHFEDKFLWKLMHSSYYNFVCDKYIPQADRLITVAQGIGEEYDRRFGIQSSIVLNSPDFEQDLTPRPVEKNLIKLVHHGIANSSRKLEKMIHLMDLLDQRFHLYLMLMPTDRVYLAKLKKMAQGKRITFLDPVPTTEISTFINKFDMGVFLLEPVNFNYEHALPNKFFEFIQARLGIAIGSSKEMKSIVQNNELGVVSEGFDEQSLAMKMNALDEKEIFQFKLNADKAAKTFSNEHNKLVFAEIFGIKEGWV